MKLRNFIIVLLAVLMVFAFASCKNEPKVEPESSYKIVRLTAEKGRADGWNEYDKFELLFATPVEKGDVVSVTYRTTRPIDQYNVRVVTTTNGDHRWVYEQDKSALTSYDDSDPDGWITVTYEFSDYADRVSGNKENHVMTDELYEGVSDFAFHFRGKIVAGDFMEIKEVLWNDEPVDISTVAKAALGKSGDVVRNEKNVEVIDSKDSTWKKDLVTYYVMFYADPTQHKEGKPVGVNYENDDYLTGIGVAVKSGEKVAKPADPEREGYTFGGWCKDKIYDGADTTRIWDFDNDTVTENRMLYAIWTSNEAEPDPEATIAKVTVTQGYEDDYDNYDRFQLTFADQVLAKDSVVTFKYRSTRKISSYSLRAVDGGQKVFYYNTANVVTSTAEDGWTTVTFTMPEKTYSKGVDAEGNKIKSSDSYALVDVDYAKFATEGQGFYICLHGSVTKDDYVEIKDFKIGENDIDLSKKAAVKSGSVTMVAESDDAIPQTCAVFFYEDPSSKKASSYVIHPYGEAFAAPTAPVKEGYEFQGWNKKDDGSGAYWNFEGDAGKNWSDRQLYAIFAEI